VDALLANLRRVAAFWYDNSSSSLGSRIFSNSVSDFDQLDLAIAIVLLIIILSV